MSTWFVYDYCADLAATRRFYGELLGLATVWDEPDGIAFTHDCVQLSFRLREVQADAPSGWAFQPGWGQGQLADAPPVEHVRSTSIAMSPDRLRAAVARLQDAGVAVLRPEPSWVGYWSFVVRDPDGQTVELSDPVTPGPGRRADPAPTAADGAPAP
jgi:catechol 2,3-dioxygenase-like lactoylglutathione lyase family enzyme